LVIKRNFNVQFTHKELYIARTAGLTPGTTAIAISSCASPSAGKNRFMSAQKPEPWTDIYPAVYWPNAAPQPLDNFYANKYLAFYGKIQKII
jgi:hypothetical protein